jgi:hypothetical protein
MAFQQYPQKGGIPSGNTAARPSSPVTGDTYYDGTLGFLLIWEGTQWIPCSAPAAQPSLTVTDVGTNIAYGTVQASVLFVEGVTGGKAAGFTLTQGSTSTTSTSNPVTRTITGTTGSYSFTGTAYNGFGTSPTSITATQTLTSLPNVPTSPTGVGAFSQLVASWTAPADNGGKAITQYTVTRTKISDSSTTTATTTTTSYTWAGLTIGDVYKFKVKATNANGTGLDSADSANITIVGVPSDMSLLLIAGGGGGSSGGGFEVGGGGGAGGYREFTDNATFANSFTVTVGAGGAFNTNNARGTKGGTSTCASYNATGGGGGGGYNAIGGIGGSGGGNNGPVSSTPATGNEGGYSPVEGYSGGYNSGGGASASIAGGGGGAGLYALSPTGGVGRASSITGSSISRAGGGGGGGSYDGSGGGSATSGGGAGGYGNSVNGTDGTANTGGGGGGDGGNKGSSNRSGSGGSGLVVISYNNAYPALSSIGGGLTYDQPTVSGKRVYRFTAGTGTVAF